MKPTAPRRALLLTTLAASMFASSLAHAQADLILTHGKVATMAREGEFVQAHCRC